VSLSWSVNTNSAKTSFQVERKTGAGGAYAVIAVVDNGASYLDTSVTAGTQYYYRVKAMSDAGESNYSDEANATPIAGQSSMPLVDLKLWLKADSEVYRNAQDGVRVWADQSGNLNHAIAPAVANQPVW